MRSESVPYIETEHKSSAALFEVLTELIMKSIDISLHNFLVYISIALDLIITDSILFYFLLKQISLLSGIRYVIKLCKLREFSKFFVVFVAKDEAYNIVGFEEASDHPGIVEDLGSSFD